MNKSIQKAWDFIWDNFFYPPTNLIYDYLVRDLSEPLIGHLPSPEQIKAQYPNPCGCGTGMEDSVLSAGSLIDGMLAHYHATYDETMPPLIEKIFDGMMRCAVDIDRGFIARSVSPVDGSSFYYDTSRDQYTHWIYGALRLYGSELCTEEQAEDIRRVLVAVAKRFEENVTEATDYNFLRYDGGRSLCGKVWGRVGTHEFLRLPLVYAAAWRVSGDPHWYEQYMKYRDAGMEGTEKFDPAQFSRHYPVLQMQYSLRGLYDIDSEEAFRERCRSMMQKVADYYTGKVPQLTEAVLAQLGESIYYYAYKPWDQCELHHVGTVDGRVYLNAAQSEKQENVGFYWIRDVGEAVSIVALCPDARVSDECLACLERLCEEIDCERHSSYAPMLLVCGYFLAEENRIGLLS